MIPHQSPTHELGLRVRRAAGRILTAAVVIAVVAWVVLLRPTGLGGSTTYVFVGGPSMTPTFLVGDLVLAQPRQAYQPGMVIVYRIPAGEPGAGRLVVHRIVGGTADAGFTTQGDNNDYTDIWHPRAADIVGTVETVVPKAGLAVTTLRQPLVAATIAAIVTVLLLWPRRRKPEALVSVPPQPQHLLPT